MIIVIDGVPGSGKTSLATWLASASEERGLTTELWLETTPNHPIHPVPVDEHGAAWADIHHKITAEEFVAASLANWKVLVDSHTDRTVILESFPFQSTLRVLIQMNAKASLIESFWEEWQALASEIKLVVLRVNDVDTHFREVCRFRGTEWSDYVHSALAKTPFAQSRGLSQDQAAMALFKEFSDRMSNALSSAPYPYLSVLGGVSLSEREARQVANWIFGDK